MTPNCRAPSSSRVSPMSGLNLCFRKRGMGEIHTKRPEEGTGSGARAGWRDRDKGLPPVKAQVQSRTRETRISLKTKKLSLLGCCTKACALVVGLWEGAGSVPRLADCCRQKELALWWSLGRSYRVRVPAGL